MNIELKSLNENVESHENKLKSPHLPFKKINNYITNIDDEEDIEPEIDLVDGDHYFYEDTNLSEENYNLEKKKSLSLGSFDEKDELISENETQKAFSPTKVLARSISSGLNAASDLSPSPEKPLNETKSVAGGKTGKSQFYLPDIEQKNVSYLQQTVNELFSGLTLLPKHVFKEKFVFGLHNVTCIYSTAHLNVNTLRTENVSVHGKLLLTNFKLAFLPYQNKYDTKIFTVDPRLELFRNDHSPLDLVIPLSFVYDIKACKYIFK